MYSWAIGVKGWHSVKLQSPIVVRSILPEPGRKTRTLNTLKWYKIKKDNPYVSYRNCALFYVRFDESKMTAQDIRFLSLYKNQDYRWHNRKITDTQPVS